jgi:hypothetical protein
LTLIALAVALLGLFGVAKLFMPANRQIKRIESAARSPVYSQLSGKSINPVDGLVY